MTLGQFAPKPKIDSDPIQAKQMANRPMLLRVEQMIPDFTSTKYPEPKNVVIVDIVDLASGQVYIGPLWGAGRVVDDLTPYAGTDQLLPVKLIYKMGGNSREYLVPEALTGQELAYAEQFHAAYPTLLTDHRAARVAQAMAAAPAQVAPAPGLGFGGAAPLAPVAPAPVQPVAQMVAPVAPVAAPAPVVVAAPPVPAMPAPAALPTPAAPVPAPVPQLQAPSVPAQVAPVAPVPAPAMPAMTVPVAPAAPGVIDADAIQAAIAQLGGTPQAPAA